MRLSLACTKILFLLIILIAIIESSLSYSLRSLHLKLRLLCAKSNIRISPTESPTMKKFDYETTQAVGNIL